MSNQRKVASYIGAGIADPLGWTRIPPVPAPPNGQAYITDGGSPLRYAIDVSGNYLTKSI